MGTGRSRQHHCHTCCHTCCLACWLVCCLLLPSLLIVALTAPAVAAGAVGQGQDDLPPLRAEAPCNGTALYSPQFSSRLSPQLSPEGQFAVARATAWLAVLEQAARLSARLSAGLWGQQQGLGTDWAGLADLARLARQAGGEGPADGVSLAACLYALEDATYSHTGGRLAVLVRLVPHGQPRERLALCLREAAFPALYGLLAQESREALRFLQSVLIEPAGLAAPKIAPDISPKISSDISSGVSPNVMPDPVPAGEADTEAGAEARRLCRKLDGLWLALMALELSPEGWYGRAGALPSLERAAQLAPGSPAVLLLLGEALLRQDLPQQSLEACTAALRLDSNLAHAHYVRALAHWRLQQLALAETDLDAALELAHAAEAPGSGLARTQGMGVGLTRCLRARGAVRLLRGNAEGMCADLRAACALGDCAALAGARQQGECGGTAGYGDTVGGGQP